MIHRTFAFSGQKSALLRKRLLAASLIAITLAPAGALAALVESYPASNQFTQVSGTDIGNAGGITWAYSNLTPNLYWGPDAMFPPQAGLDGTYHNLTLSNISGDVATWTGTTSWLDPNNNVNYTNVPLTLQISVTGLGANPWVSFATANGSDPTGVGAIVSDPTGMGFSANVYLYALTVAGQLPLNSVEQAGSGGQAVENFGGAFYTPAAVPLPAAAWLLLSGFGGLGLLRRRRSTG